MKKYFLAISVTGAALLGMAATSASAGVTLPSKYQFLLHEKKGNINTLSAAQRTHVLKIENQARAKIKAIRAGKAKAEGLGYIGSLQGALQPFGSWHENIDYQNGYYFGYYFTGPDYNTGYPDFACTFWISYNGVYYGLYIYNKCYG